MNYPHTFSSGTDPHAFSLLPDTPTSEEEDFTMQWSLAEGHIQHWSADYTNFNNLGAPFPWGQGGTLTTTPGSQLEGRYVSTFVPTIRDATH